MLLVGRTVLGGKAEIEAGLPAELARFRRDVRAYQRRALVPFKRERDTRAMRTERFEALSLGVVLAAGLLDGVNPCAFTTIIFLLSYLGLAGRTRRQLLVTGGLFTLAVFVTYLSIGILFYKLVALVTGSKLTSTIINLVLLALLLTFAVLSARDALRCLGGAPTEMSLKLPRFLSEGIRARIRAFATNRVAVGAAALALGVVIASMELVCTGQVYIPIVVMISEPRYRAEATLNLLAYNLAFIAPLLLVFLLASLGMTSQRLARFARKKMALFKLGLTLVFLAMALVIVHNLGWFRLGW
jgi:cytochrome c biogenesis protein CcdA